MAIQQKVRVHYARFSHCVVCVAMRFLLLCSSVDCVVRFLFPQSVRENTCNEQRVARFDLNRAQPTCIGALSNYFISKDVPTAVAQVIFIPYEKLNDLFHLFNPFVLCKMKPWCIRLDHPCNLLIRRCWVVRCRRFCTHWRALMKGVKPSWPNVRSEAKSPLKYPSSFIIMNPERKVNKLFGDIVGAHPKWVNQIVENAYRSLLKFENTSNFVRSKTLFKRAPVTMQFAYKRDFSVESSLSVCFSKCCVLVGAVIH